MTFGLWITVKVDTEKKTKEEVKQILQNNRCVVCLQVKTYIHKHTQRQWESK